MDLVAENFAKRIETVDNLVNHKKKKRKLEREESLQDEISYLKEKLPIFLSLKQFHFLEGPTIEDIRHNNKTLRENVKSLLQTLHNINIPEAGQNTSDHCVEHGGVVLPPKSEFRKLDVANLDELGSSYDLILMDPPWSNKHVKRAKKTNIGYQMMDNDAYEKAIK